MVFDVFILTMAFLMFFFNKLHFERIDFYEIHSNAYGWYGRLPRKRT